MCVEQENHERETAEKRRRQQREKEALSHAAKRRSIATCSSHESDALTLESVLSSFLADRPARRRQPLLKKDCPTESFDSKNPLAETSLSGISSSEQLQEPGQGFKTKKAEMHSTFDNSQTPAGQKRGPCVDEKETSKSSDCMAVSHRSIVINKDTIMSVEESSDKERGDQAKKQEESDQVPEVSQKGHPKPAFPSDTFSSPVRSEVDLALHSGLVCVGSPWTVLSPHVSPRNTPHRRHTLSPVTRDEELDDGVWALTDTPVRNKHPLLSHVCRSYEHSVSTSLLTSTGVDGPSAAPLLRSASVGSEPPDSSSGFRLGGLFQRRNCQDPPVAKRPESSSLVTFFRRFGERGRPASVGDCHRADA